MQSTQTSPPRVGSSFDYRDAMLGAHDSNEVPPSKRKLKSKAAKKQKLERELHRQAEERKLEARMRARDAAQKKEDDYICLFCEYEAVFGETPWALVRLYELKDRRRRKEEAERKRLIEKAKSRSRKNRKASGKSNSKSNSTSHQQGQHQTFPQPSQPIHTDHADDVTDEFYEEDADEDGYQHGVSEEGFEEREGPDPSDHAQHARRLVGSAGGSIGPSDGGGAMNPNSRAACTCCHD